MFVTIIVLFLKILFSAFCLWAGMKITKVQGNFLAMLIIATIGTLLTLTPVAGWIIGTIAMFFLICKWTDAALFPDAILMVVVARGVGFLIALALGGMLVSLKSA